MSILVPTNYFTRTLIKFDKHHNRNILVLKPNCEFLMWKFPPSIIELQCLTIPNNVRVENANGYLLFYCHYLAAQKIIIQSSKQYRQRRIRRRVRQSTEIRKIWNSADKQIHFEYEKLAFQFKLGNYLNIQTDSIKMLIILIKIFTQIN